jgi:hypothetical protein
MLPNGHPTPVKPKDNGYSAGYQGSSSDKRKQSADEPLVPSFSDRSSCSSSPQPQSHLHR